MELENGENRKFRSIFINSWYKLEEVTFEAHEMHFNVFQKTNELSHNINHRKLLPHTFRGTKRIVECMHI